MSDIKAMLSALTELCNTAISGEVPQHARQAFLSASLVAIRKKDGGVRPVADGSTFRRLAFSLLARHMSSALATEL